jgi:hypothetical protein
MRREPISLLKRTLIMGSVAIPCMGLEATEIMYAANWAQRGTTGFWALVTFAALIILGLVLGNRLLVLAGNNLDFRFALQEIVKDFHKRYRAYYPHFE